MQYKVIQANTPQSMTIEVNHWIEQGWTISPGFSVVLDNGSQWFYQPMVKA